MKKIKTVPMNPEWFESLRKRGLTADSVFTEYEAEPFKKKLLEVGGEAVILPGRWPVEFDELADNGKFMSAIDAKMWKLSACSCHQNVEYIITRFPRFQGFTGYALSKDGVWRNHSWAFDPSKNCVRETTVLRLIYYGIPFIKEYHFESVVNLPR